MDTPSPPSDPAPEIILPDVPEEAPVVAPPPVVVVRYRRSWSARLLPPVLIVLVALALFRVRISDRDWSGAWSSAERTSGDTPVAVADAHPHGPTPLVAPKPLVAHGEHASPPVIEAAPEPGPGPQPEEFTPAAPPEREPTVALGFVPPGQGGDAPSAPISPFDLTENAPLVPAPPDAVVDDQAEIEAEARRIREERDSIAGLKGELLQREMREAEARRQREHIESYRKVESDRALFRKDLDSVIRSHGNDAGPRIVELTQRYGQVAPLHARERAARVLQSRSGSRMTPREKIEFLRGLGISEPAILTEVLHYEVKNIGYRRGPKDKVEALVTAGRILLSAPLRMSSKNAASAAGDAQKRPLQ